MIKYYIFYKKQRLHIISIWGVMFKKNKKEKKEKNKNSSSFFSNLNTDNSTIEYGFDEKNPKSKATKWVIGGLLLGATITGIAVPWSLSSCTLSVAKPIQNNDVMYSYYDPINNKSVSVTYREFLNRINNIQISNSIFDQYKDVFYISSLENLYKQEREAYLKFKAIYTKLHDKGPEINSFGANLDKSFSKIEDEQRKILNDNKKNFQKAVNNSSSWYELWIKELQTNSIYGPQKAEEGSTNADLLEKKAIYYMVVQQIKSSALARYQGAEIKTDVWDYTDYDFATNGQTTSSWDKIEYTNDQDKKSEITKAEAQTIWKAYINKDSNAKVPYNPNTENNTKVAVLETKSYCIEWRNPVNQQNVDVLSKYYNFALSSSITLSTIKPGSTNADPFAIDADALKALLTINIENNINNITNNFIPISQISSFKGANSICTTAVADANISQDKDPFIQNVKDKVLQKSIGGSDTQDLGSSKFINLNNYLTSSTEESSSTTVDMFRLMAFTSGDTGATSPTDYNQIFSIKKQNPIKVFMDLLFTIKNSSTHKIDFQAYPEVKEIWEKLGNPEATASNELFNFVDFLFSNIDENDYTFKQQIEPNDYNTQLSNLITSLQSNDWSFLGNLLTSIFASNNPNEISTDYTDVSQTRKIGYWSLYELGAPTNDNNNIGTYMYVSTSGIQIFSKSFEKLTLDKLQKMVTSDLIQTIETKGDTSSITYYDAGSIFSNLNNDNLIIAIILQDDDSAKKFKDKIKETIDNSSSSNSIEKDPEKIFSNFIDQAVLSFNSELIQTKYNIISSVPSALTTIIDEKRTYDFATLNDNITAENIAIFQTTTKYKDQAFIKSKDEIDNYFITALNKMLQVDILTPTRKGEI